MPVTALVLLISLFTLICVLDFIYVRWMRIIHMDTEMLLKRVKHLEEKILHMDNKLDDIDKD